MSILKRVAVGVAGVAAGVTFLAAPAMAHQCTNASKPADAGIQLLIGPNDEVVWATNGLQRRIEQGLIDPDTGEGFSGLVGIDFTGDGVADFSTYIVGPNGEIPGTAQERGAVCRGIINLGVYFEQCLGA